MLWFQDPVIVHTPQGHGLVGNLNRAEPPLSTLTPVLFQLERVPWRGLTSPPCAIVSSDSCELSLQYRYTHEWTLMKHVNKPLFIPATLKCTRSIVQESDFVAPSPRWPIRFLFLPAAQQHLTSRQFTNLAKRRLPLGATLFNHKMLLLLVSLYIVNEPRLQNVITFQSLLL